AGLVLGSAQDRIASSARCGAVTGVVVLLVVAATFAVIDNAFLDVVMQQPDKATGFARSGLTNARDYVNRGNLALVPLAVFFGAVGGACGAVGGLIRERIDRL